MSEMPGMPNVSADSETAAASNRGSRVVGKSRRQDYSSDGDRSQMNLP
jgi:hypothetical protein